MKPVDLLRDIRQPADRSLQAQAEAMARRYKQVHDLRRAVGITYTAPPERRAA